MTALKPYSEYKDSGVEWIGPIPATFELVRVGDIAKIINGFPFDASRFGAVGSPLLRIRDLGAVESATRFDGPDVPSVRVTCDDVLVGMDGDFNVGRWFGSGTALLNQRMLALRGDRVTLRLIELSLPVPLQRINDETYATTVKHLSSGQVRAIKLPMPASREERRAVVEYLDRETAEIDAFIADQEELMGLLAERRAATITHAVTKGLDLSAPMQDSGVEWLGYIPHAWTVAPLKVLATVQTGVTLGKEFGDGVEYPYLRVANVQIGRVDTTEVKTITVSPSVAESSRLRRGDVLMTEGGDRDKLARGAIWDGRIDPCLHQNHVFAVRCDSAVLDSRWLTYVLDGLPARCTDLDRC